MTQIHGIFCGSFGCLRTRLILKPKGDAMNIEHYINLAHDAMTRQTDYSYGTYALVVRSRKLTCIAACGRMKDDIDVAEVTRYQLEHGMTSKGWTQLGDKVMKVFKELHL